VLRSSLTCTCRYPSGCTGRHAGRARSRFLPRSFGPGSLQGSRTHLAPSSCPRSCTVGRRQAGCSPRPPNLPDRRTSPTSRRCLDYGIAGHTVGGDPAPGILSLVAASVESLPVSFSLKGSRGRWRNLQCLSGFPCKGASPKKPQFSVEFDLAWQCQQLGSEANAGRGIPSDRSCIGISASLTAIET